jgi:hypothetical protein
MKFVTKVDRNTGMNPVARAIAKQKLKDSITSHRISIFLLDDGEDAASEMVATSLPVYAMMTCYEELKKTESVEYRKLKSAGNILLQCSESGFKWKREFAITIDNALQICQDEWTRVPPKVLNQAINTLTSASTLKM